MIDDPYAYSNPSQLTVPSDWVPITPGPNKLPKVLRAIRANTEGTVTVNTLGGENRVLNFLAGETRQGMFTHVTAATATGLEGAI